MNCFYFIILNICVLQTMLRFLLHILFLFNIMYSGIINGLFSDFYISVAPALL